MTSSLDEYPNAYDLQAIEDKRKVLENYLLDIKWCFKFNQMTIEEKKQEIENICLEIDRQENKKI